ncbi:hypothetical protein LLH06_02880 [Mucilaginibacter daejeonensis]|uniref:hypothetical protein n=1 Tax=Mucilaginibacter daejeonensis TaxID=398049 RepID=UPI001D177C87|nr:hypothetical protein [Mucilaginibacter daejeonensis]UEG53918.1 hypothetical protein LLH06_02880 [Mucilaginibacter daejeonensis]
MKTLFLVFIHLLCACVLISAACSGTERSDLVGKWHTKDGQTKLQITEKKFIITDENGPVPEDYFVKGDTIFTSFEGNQPYSKFVIEHIDESELKLLYPDSVSVDLIR